MSNFKEIIEDAKKVLADLKLKFKNELKFGSIGTSDGKTVTFEGEMLAVGMPVTIDGAPAPDGVYTLESGMILEVKEGVAASLEDPASEPADMSEQFAAIETKFEAKFAEIETKFTEATGKLETMISTLAEQFGKTLEVVSEFSAQAPPPEEKPLNKKQAKMQADNARFQTIADTLKNLKK
jgi:hypothetical protein